MALYVIWPKSQAINIAGVVRTVVMLGGATWVLCRAFKEGADSTEPTHRSQAKSANTR